MSSYFTKARDEQRLTTSVLYPANQRDVAGEFATPDALEAGLHHLIRSNDRRVRLQHNRSIVAGELVGAISWPQEVTADLITGDGSVAKSAATFPASSIYASVKWQPWAWNLVRSRRVNGLSMGGSGRRTGLDADVDPADPLVKSAVAKSLGDGIPEASGFDDSDEVEATIDAISGPSRGVAKSANPSDHEFQPGPGGRCLWDSYSREFHESISKARAYTSRIQPCPPSTPPITSSSSTPRSARPATPPSTGPGSRAGPSSWASAT